MFCGFRGWFRQPDGNYLPSRKLRKVIKRILDVVLDVSASLATNPEPQPPIESIVLAPPAGESSVDRLDPMWLPFDETDCLGSFELFALEQSFFAETREARARK